MYVCWRFAGRIARARYRLLLACKFRPAPAGGTLPSAAPDETDSTYITDRLRHRYVRAGSCGRPPACRYRVPAGPTCSTCPPAPGCNQFGEFEKLPIASALRPRACRPPARVLDNSRRLRQRPHRLLCSAPPTRSGETPAAMPASTELQAPPTAPSWAREYRLLQGACRRLASARSAGGGWRRGAFSCPANLFAQPPGFFLRQSRSISGTASSFAQSNSVTFCSFRSAVGLLRSTRSAAPGIPSSIIRRRTSGVFLLDSAILVAITLSDATGLCYTVH